MSTAGAGSLTSLLSGMLACTKAMDWSRPYALPRDAWVACPRADWLAYFLAGVGYDRRSLVAMLIDIAGAHGYTSSDVARVAAALADADKLTELKRDPLPIDSPMIGLLSLARGIGEDTGDSLRAPLWACGVVAQATGIDVRPVDSWHAALAVSADAIRGRVRWSEVDRLIADNDGGLS